MKVLIAEDDAVLRRLLSNNLEKWGHEVVAAEDGEIAWNHFQGTFFPLVITDWMMPKVDGLELVRRIRADERPDYAYILMLTAKSQKEDLITGMEAGADDFVTKPFERDELRVRLRAGERILTLQRQLISTEKLASLGRVTEGIIQQVQEPITYLNNNMATLRQDVGHSMRLLQKYREGFEDLNRANAALAGEIHALEGHRDPDHLQIHVPRQFTTMLDQLQNLRGLVNRLQDYTQRDEREEAERKQTDINAALSSLIEIVHTELARKKIQLETQLEAVPTVMGQPGKLNRAFLNLLINAIQACGPGDTLRVRTSIETDASSGEQGILIEIVDTGRGISPEHLPHIFEPFFTTKTSGQGEGMGLSVSYGIVRDHGGTLEAESREGQGSLFRVRLPLAPKEG